MVGKIYHCIFDYIHNQWVVKVDPFYLHHMEAEGLYARASLSEPVNIRDDDEGSTFP